MSGYSFGVRIIKEQLILSYYEVIYIAGRVYNMEYIKINDKTYGYAVDFKDNDALRNSYNCLTKKTYGFDFEEWYQNGYWQDGYIPYSILDGNNIISNVSVSVMDFFIMGEKIRYIQIGTVMTDKEYRNQGLSRYLMEKVLEEWKERCDLIYLFANDSVLDFYPKLGFISAPEYQHSREILAENSTSNIIRLNMLDEKDRNFLLDTISGSFNFAQLAMYNNTSLIMFYCTSFMKENVYYIKALDTIAIAEFEGSILYLNDIYCKQDVSLDDIIEAMVNKEIKKIVLGFTPKHTTSFDNTLLKEEDTTLFIMEDKLKIFNNSRIMFPVLSHA
jgi:GNAT superfamily N-acetyltransferase